MSERLTQILAEYKQAIDAAQTKRQKLLDANPDLADELLKHFDATGEPSIADTMDFGKPQFDTVAPVPRAEFDTVTPVPHQEFDTAPPASKNSQARKTASNASRFGDYELIEKIAQGGMGVVYKARQKKADRIVALKMILSGQLAGEDEVSRFHAEAKAAAKLEHPGIVPVYDVGEIDGKHYFSMGYVEGGNLSEKLKDGPLHPRIAAEYMKSIAEAVAFAHEHGVIHRDLKPGNILVGSDGQPRVTDFGLAKQLEGDSDLTATGQVMGTPSYMPPEQAVGNLDEIGATSDVYSLGAVFYCLLTCRPPFQAASHVEVLRQVIEQEPAGLRLLNRSIPKDIETICLKCLRKEPAQRYASSEDLADDLQRWLNNEPIKARPVGRLEKSWLWCKRRPTLVATVVTAALLLVVVSWYLIIRGSDAEATRLVDGLLGADTSNVDGIITELSGYRKCADDDLAAAYEDPPADLPNAKLHASLALLQRGDTSVLETLKDDLLTVSPAQFQHVRDLMSDHQDTLIDDYWKIVKDEGDTGEDAVARRFQAACALATYDAEDEYWENHEFAQFIANHLVNVRFSALGPWQQALYAVRADLVDPLAEIFRDDTLGESERAYATETLADYLQDDPKALSRLLIDADAEAFQTLIPVLAPHRHVAIDELHGILNHTTKPDWKDPPINPIWSEVPADANTAIESAHGMISERFAFCQTLRWERFAELADRLGAAGYRPTRVRPYSESMNNMVAAIWLRDGGRFELETNLTREQLPASDSPATKDGLVPVDFAVQLAEDSSEPRFLILWGELATMDEQRRLLCDLNEEQLAAAQRALTKAGFASQATIAIWADEEGQRHYGGIWSSQGAVSELNPAYGGFELMDQPQWDVAVARPAKLPDPLDTFRERLSLFESWPKDRIEQYSEQTQFRYDRARAHFHLGQFVPALEDLDFLVAQEPPSAVAFYFRSFTLAALNKPEPSAASLSKYLELDDDPSRRARAQIVHASWSGDHEGAFDQLDAATAAFSQDPGGLYNIACAAALAAKAPLGDGDSPASTYVDRALALLASMIAQGYSNGDQMGSDVALVALHGDARFLELLAQLIPPARYGAVWRADVNFESRLVTASTHEMLVRVPELVRKDFRPISITIRPVLNASSKTSIVFHRPVVPDELKERLALQQATAATALLRLKETSQVWPLLTHRADSRLRSYFLHRLVPYEAEPAAALEQLQIEAEVSRHRGLILAIGEFARADRLSDEQRSSVTAYLAKRYAEDPDSGIHGAAEWSLRQLGAAEQIATVRETYATGQVVGDRQWYLTKEGKQTMVVLNAQESFLMGSPVTEADRTGGPASNYELRHRRRIGRRFAIAAHEVTVAQFERFRADHPFNRTYSRESDAPANEVDWYAAAAFCNWLSREERIPRDQWCFDPDQDFDEGMTLPPDHLERTGYRLPTEAEWEFACRAGSQTARHFGETELLLGQYAWHKDASRNKWMLPVGSLKPNDAGLFDTLGNALEWSVDRSLPYKKDREYSEDPGADKIDNIIAQTMRGGSFYHLAERVRSANRYLLQARARSINNGFRLVRTLTP